MKTLKMCKTIPWIPVFPPSRWCSFVYLPRRQGHARTLQPPWRSPAASLGGSHSHWRFPGPLAALSTRRLWQPVQAQPTVGEARNARSYCSGQPGGTEADGETSSMEGRMLRCVLWIQNQRLSVEASAGWSPMAHSMAPFIKAFLGFLSLPSHLQSPPVSAGFGSNMSYWYLKPCLNVCLLDKWIETLRRDTGIGSLTSQMARGILWLMTSQRVAVLGSRQDYWDAHLWWIRSR